MNVVESGNTRATKARNASKLNRSPPSRRPRPKRPTKAEKALRINTVETMLLGGGRDSEILQFAASQWGINERQARYYIAEATALIKSDAAKNREELVAEHIGRMNQIYRSAHSAGDYGNAIRAAQDKAKLCGLYPAERHEVTGAGGAPLEVMSDVLITKMTNADLDKLIANLEAAIRLGTIDQAQTNATGVAGMDAAQPSDADAGPSV